MHRATGAGLPEADQPARARQHQQAGEAGNRDGGDLTETGRTEVVRVPGPIRCRGDERVVRREDPIRRRRSAGGQLAGGAGMTGKT